MAECGFEIDREEEEEDIGEEDIREEDLNPITFEPEHCRINTNFEKIKQDMLKSKVDDF